MARSLRTLAAERHEQLSRLQYQFSVYGIWVSHGNNSSQGSIVKYAGNEDSELAGSEEVLCILLLCWPVLLIAGLLLVWPFFLSWSEDFRMLEPGNKWATKESAACSQPSHQSILGYSCALGTPCAPHGGVESSSVIHSLWKFPKERYLCSFSKPKLSLRTCLFGLRTSFKFDSGWENISLR